MRARRQAQRSNPVVPRKRFCLCLSPNGILDCFVALLPCANAPFVAGNDDNEGVVARRRGGTDLPAMSSLHAKNILLRLEVEAVLLNRPSRLGKRGVCAIVTKREAGCDGRGMSLDEGYCRGRSSRMVLTPRRRRQASRKHPQGDGDKKARSPGRVRNRPLKPIARGMPGETGVTVVTTLVWFFTSIRGCGCIAHPAFPAPSDFRGLHRQ
jgi:hypothetical protein